LGILDGRNAVCYPGFEKYLKNAKISEDYVCRDGKVITAKGMGVAIDFALEIAKYFIGEAATAELRETLMCNE
jgi:4-methyl-5(b-hydroxyethyl)-thiazole monophosphate biosynthesis